MNNYVLCDIGDGQSITENLSTFSSHITNIIKILELAGEQSLVLLDELGSGTDPTEGMGLAIAIIETLIDKGCLFIATTHYPEVKEFAHSSPSLVNARMSFDMHSLLPLYELEIGEAGESCALYIARRLGLEPKLIERASLAAYGCIKDIAFTENHNEASTSFSETQPQPTLTRVVCKDEVKKFPPYTQNIGFNIGDSVFILPQEIIGIIYQKANAKGEVGVQMQNKKLLINHKRLKLHVKAEELYPEDYDFSIIFDSVEDRKKRHEMARKHNAKLVLETNKKLLSQPIA